MTDQQPTVISPTPPDEIAHYPFPFEHSMTCPAGYARARETGPVVKVHMPFGGDAYLVANYMETVKAFGNPQCAMIRYSDGKLPRMEEGDIIGASAQNEGIFFGSSDTLSSRKRTLFYSHYRLLLGNEPAFLMEVWTRSQKREFSSRVSSARCNASSSS